MAALNEEKLGSLKGSLLNAYSGALAVVNLGIGIQLGLYDVLASTDGISSAELAEKTGTNKRYLDDWLVNQTLNGFVTRTGDDGPAGTGLYSLSPEQKACLACDSGLHDMGGGAVSILGVANQAERISENFRSGDGLAWSEQHPLIHSVWPTNILLLTFPSLFPSTRPVSRSIFLPHSGLTVVSHRECGDSLRQSTATSSASTSFLHSMEWKRSFKTAAGCSTLAAGT